MLMLVICRPAPDADLARFGQLLAEEFAALRRLKADGVLNPCRLGGPRVSACLAREVGQPAEGLVCLSGVAILQVRGHPLAGDVQPD
jgi:hypothetical protein